MSPLTSGLIKDSELLESNIVKRAAALFTIFDLNYVDTYLLFQNYWNWKRGIEVFGIISLRNKSGKLITSQKIKKLSNTNSFSVKKICQKEKIPFSYLKHGTVEIEIISKDNLYFPFPAIIGLFKSNSGHFSSVHAAGRTTDRFNPQKFSETNFYSKFSNQYKPFIHLFNGKEGKLDNLSIEIKSKGEAISSPIKSLDKPFQSEVIFIDNYFNIDKSKETICLKSKSSKSKEIALDDNTIILVKGTCESIFPRFIAGNYDLHNNYPCVTHTFREIVHNDVIQYTNEEINSSTIALPVLHEDIDLKIIIYPTISPEKTEVEVRAFDLNSLSFLKSYSQKDLSSKEGKPIVQSSNINKNLGIGLIAQSYSEIKNLPARIPVNLLYSLKNIKSSLHTDIALQMRTKFAKRKINFWYNNILDQEYVNIILGSSFMGRSFDSNSKQDLKFRLIFNIENSNTFHEKDFHFGNSESRSFLINLNEIFKDEIYTILNNISNELITFSWRIELVNGEMQDLYCLTFNKKIGCLFGDHSF